MFFKKILFTFINKTEGSCGKRNKKRSEWQKWWRTTPLYASFDVDVKKKRKITTRNSYKNPQENLEKRIQCYFFERNESLTRTWRWKIV
jgi:hypothetical protein